MDGLSVIIIIIIIIIIHLHRAYTICPYSFVQPACLSACLSACLINDPVIYLFISFIINPP